MVEHRHADSLHQALALTAEHPDFRWQCERHHEVELFLAANFRETDFRADLGGFLEYRFLVWWGTDLADPVAAGNRCRAPAHGLTSYRPGA